MKPPIPSSPSHAPPVIRSNAPRSPWKVLVPLMAIGLFVVFASGVFLAAWGVFSKSQSQGRFTAPRQWPEHVTASRSRPQGFGQAAPSSLREKKVKEKPTGPQAAPPEFSVRGGVFTSNLSV